MMVNLSRIMKATGFAVMLGLSEGAALAQMRVPETCSAPPFDAGAIRRLSRGPEFDRLMRQMARACPQIAMVFAEVMIGPVKSADPRRWLVLLPFAPAELLAAQDY